MKKRKETMFEYRIKLDVEDADFLISHGVDPAKLLSNMVKLLVSQARSDISVFEKGLRISRREMKKLRGGKPILLEVFENITIKVYSKKVDPQNYQGKLMLYVFDRKPDAKHITLEDLKNYVERLNTKYPGENFYIRRVRIGHKTLYVLTKRKKTARLPCVDIYFDLDEQRFFVPKKTYEKQPRLVNYILFRTLGTLGVIYNSKRIVVQPPVLQNASQST